MGKKILTIMLALLTTFVGMQAMSSPPARKTMETATWKVVLQSSGVNKMAVIKVVHEQLGIGLTEAKALVEAAPVTLLENAYYDPAKSLYDALVDAGATANLIDTDPEYAPPIYVGGWSVWLENAGESKLNVVKAVRDVLGIGLADAKALVEGAPCFLAEGIDQETAQALYDAVVAAGATAELIDNGVESIADRSGEWLMVVSGVTTRIAFVNWLVNELGYGLNEANRISQQIPGVLFCGSCEEAFALCERLNSSTVANGYVMRVQDGSMEAPTDLAISNTSYSNTTASWTPGKDETKWIVRYGEPSDESTAVTQSWAWDFESGDKGEWTTIDADGDGYDWYLTISGEYEHYLTMSGDACITSASWIGGALTPDDWLVSPQLPLGGTFSFWAVAQDPDFSHENFAVYVSTSGNTNPSDFVQVSEEFETNAEYTLYSIDLSEFTGMGYIAIRHFNSYDEFCMNVDDISYELTTYQAASDNWTYALNVDANPYDITNMKSGTDFIAQVMALKDNCRNTSGWSAPVMLKTKPLQAPDYIWAANVKQDHADLIWSAGSGETKWNMRLWKDGDPDYDFEDGNILDGWKVVDVSQNDYTWVAYSGYGIDGSTCMLANDCYGDDWLILPKTHLEGFFTFWATAAYPEDAKNRFGVYISTTDDDISSFQQVASWDFPAGWQLMTVDLDSYYGVEGYIAIRTLPGTNRNWLHIDNLRLMNDYFDGTEWVNPVKYTTGVTSSYYGLYDLDKNTTYFVQLQGVMDSGETTPWSETVTFTTWSDIVFETDGQWGDAPCWHLGEVPPTDADVIIAAECDIPAGFTAEAHSVKMGNPDAVLTIKEGGQLKYQGNRTLVWYEFNIKANTYYYLRLQKDSDFPEEMLEGSYSIEGFDQNGWHMATPKEIKTSLTYLGCFRYRRSSDLTVQFWAYPAPTDSRIANSIYFTKGTPFEGYTLRGNAYSCNCWPCYDYERTTLRPYWVMNDEGELVPGSGPIAPMQAVFFKREGVSDTDVYFSPFEPIYQNPVTAPENVTATNISGASASLSWTDHGGELSWNIRYREADNGTWQHWDFEGSEQGWTTINSDGDSYNWEYYDYSTSAHTGVGYFYSDTKEGTDEWLISPKVDLGGILSFWARGYFSGTPDHLTVYVSPNNFDTANFQQASQHFEIYGNSGIYKEYTVDLSDINASGKGYIALRHHNSTKGGEVKLDDVSYMTYPASGYVAPSEWTEKSGVGTHPYSIGGLKPLTKYDIQVQAVFEGEGRISDWSPIYQFTTGEGAATGISVWEQDGIPVRTYDLQGRRIDTPTKRGIYIRNGHKVVMK